MHMQHTRLTVWLLLLMGCNDASSTQGADSGVPSVADAGPRGDGGKGDSGPSADAGPDDPGKNPTTLDACLSELSEPDSGFISIQRFRSSDGKVKLARARQTIDAPTVGETFAYAMVRFWIESDDEPGTCVRAKSALSYEYAHHNWDETWSATTELATYDGNELFNTDGGEVLWTDTLTAKSKDGKVLFGPIMLQEDGCSSIPYDLNPCLTRTRSDEPPPGWGE